MRAAPAVTVMSGDGGAWRAAQALTWGLAGAALAAWLLALRDAPLPWAWLVAVSVTVAAWALLHEKPVELAWDGQQWRANGVVCELVVALDLGAWLLLRARERLPAARTRWLPAAAGPLGGRQHAFRAALYSRAPEAPPAPEPPSRGGAAAPD
jgi:hypothetical protein